MEGIQIGPAEPEPTETGYDVDHLEFRSTVRRLLERPASTAFTASGPAGPQQTPVGYDQQLWRLLTHQVGVAGLAVPERFGGSGFGYPECHLVLEELGRAAVASPFLASAVLATQALLLAADDAAAAELLPDLAAGTRTAALAWDATAPTGATGPTEPGPLTATRGDGGWLVSGRVRFVLDGARADRLLAFAEPQNAISPLLFLLDVTHPGLERRHSPTIDQVMHLAEVRCHAVPARPLSGPARGPAGTPSSGRAVLDRLADLAATAITADQVGGARRCLELTVEYTKHRVQFGRPIGSFQAVKHRLADLLVLVESAHSASEAAAQAWAVEADDAPALAALAKSYCSEAYRAVAAETIQLHGGLGFTWEHPAHRYFKRAHSTSTLFGDPSQHRRRLADRIGLFE